MVDAGYDVAPVDATGNVVPFEPSIAPESIPNVGSPSAFAQARALQEQMRRRRN